jgi:hypothetical protein
MPTPDGRTRQRQGRDFTVGGKDFSVQEYLKTHNAALENTDRIAREDLRGKTVAEQLERFNAEAERSARPVDGDEPVDTLRPPERGL